MDKQPEETRRSSWIGGARIGTINATWPFAKLVASDPELTLRVMLFGVYRFPKEQVTLIEPFRSLLGLGNGIRLRHTVPGYDEKVIFWCAGRPEPVIRELAAWGYPTKP